jgi:polyribonucleotide nucleotidyltransferase
MMINPAKIGEVVGPKGSVINKIIEECGGVEIEIEDSGLVSITGQDQENVDKAANWIKSIVREVAVGEIFTGTVRKIMDFGAFVDILPGQSGMVHISKFVPERIERITDVVKEGDKIPVKVIGIDDQGRINLSAIDAGFSAKGGSASGGKPQPSKKSFFHK